MLEARRRGYLWLQAVHVLASGDAVRAARYARVVGAAEHLESELQQALLESDDQRERDNILKLQLSVLRGIYGKEPKRVGGSSVSRLAAVSQ